MIGQLRKQFILTTMGILLAFFAIIVCLLNVLFNILGFQQNMSLLRQLTLVPLAEVHILSEEEVDVRPIKELLGPNVDSSPIYIASLTEDNTLVGWVTVNGEGAPSAELVQLLEEALSTSDADSQRLGNYLYAIGTQPTGQYLAAMDTTNSVESTMIQRLYLISILVCFVCLVLLYPICVFLSRWVTRSAEYAFTQQKQFISDAGHELKTPLSIIAINTNVIQSQVGASKHMDYIQAEIRRMHRLISQLLTLAQMEAGAIPGFHASFSLSDTIFQEALPFESIAFEKNIDYQMDIDENINFVGNCEQIGQIVIILLDNAFKYTKDTVHISLKKSGKHRILEVYNNGSPINHDDLPYIFQRFYRCDKSRTSAEGYGLGLSIAKTIVDNHHGTITAQSSEGAGVSFRVVL